MRANDPTVKYAIFDDIAGGIKFFPNFKMWLGCQTQFSVKVLYRDPVPITWGRPAIWVANTDPRDDMDADDREWMDGNCRFVRLDTTIFHANTE